MRYDLQNPLSAIGLLDSPPRRQTNFVTLKRNIACSRPPSNGSFEYIVLSCAETVEKNKKLDRGRSSNVTVEFGQSKSLPDSKSAKNRREKYGIKQKQKLIFKEIPRDK